MSRRRRTPNDPVGNRAFDESNLLRKVLETLSDREQAILAMRFGLTETGEAMTLDEIGRMYGVSRVRIQQIEQKALARLRHPSRTQSLVVRDENGAVGGLIDVARKHGPAALDRRIFELWKANIISCGHCGKQDFASRGGAGGRPRRYCTNKCRQAAYRARRGTAAA